MMMIDMMMQSQFTKCLAVDENCSPIKKDDDSNVRRWRTGLIVMIQCKEQIPSFIIIIISSYECQSLYDLLKALGVGTNDQCQYMLIMFIIDDDYNDSHENGKQWTVA